MDTNLNAQIYENDQKEYGINTSHASASQGLMGYFETSETYKYNLNQSSDPANSEERQEYRLMSYDIVNCEGDTQQMCIDAGILTDHTDGTFYDLLPAGTTVDLSTIKVDGYNTDVPCEYSLSFVENWRDSGMTMMMIRVNTVGRQPNYAKQKDGVVSGFDVYYTLVNSWENIHDRGRTVLNSFAYYSHDGNLAAGLPDNGKGLTYQDLFNDLNGDGNPDPNSKRVTYAEVTTEFNPLMAAEIGFTKEVRTPEDVRFAQSTTATTNGSYTYQLRFQNPDKGVATNVVFYDILDNDPDKTGETWQGTFRGIDISQPRSKGIDAKVYYSTVIDSGNLSNEPDKTNLSDTSLWSTTKPEDPSTIKAVAVDLSKKKDGSGYVFEPGEVALVYIEMQAPMDKLPGFAWNSAYISATTRNYFSDDDHTLQPAKSSIEKNQPTKVALQDCPLTIKKSSNPASGTKEEPALVYQDQEFEYDIEVRNDSLAETVYNLTIEDMIPESLEADTENILYYFGSMADSKLHVSGGKHVHMTSENGKLQFVCEHLFGHETLHLIIPVKAKVSKDRPDAPVVFENSAVISAFNGRQFHTVSNTTYHEVPAASLQIHGTKLLEGRALKDGEFRFVLKDENGNEISTAENAADGMILFDPVIYRKEGTWTYTVSEDSSAKNPTITYDDHESQIEVEVTKTEDGRGLKAEQKTVNEDPVFQNTYTPLPAKVRLDAHKSLTGKDLEAGEFTFILEEDKKEVSRAVNEADGSILFPEITYTKSGEHEYTMRELDEKAGGITYDTQTAFVKVSVADENGQLTASVTGNTPEFANTYKAAPASLSLQAKKTLKGREQKAGEFTFVLEEDGKEIQKAENEADGTISFDPVEYAEAGMHDYVIKEMASDDETITSDENEYPVSVTVTDDGKGQLAAMQSVVPEFTNIYTPKPAVVQILDHKQLAGQKLQKDQFHFELTDENNQVLRTKTNDETGKIEFDPLTISAAGDYTYLVRERKDAQKGVTYDESVHAVRIHVHDENGQLAADIDQPVTGFFNLYAPKAAAISLQAQKVLNGRDIRAGEFTFVLKEKEKEKEKEADKDRDEQSTILQKANNEKGGEVHFAPIAYDQAGTYTYTIEEQDEGVPGMIYDTNVWTVTVTVTDEGGELSAKAVYEAEGKEASEKAAEFVNTFTPAAYVLSASKKLEGANLQAGEFQFELREQGQDKDAVLARNERNGDIPFEELRFEKPGDFVYEISETNTKRNDIEYDSSVYLLKVHVEADRDNQLQASAQLTKDGKETDRIVFTNRKKAVKPGSSGTNKNGAKNTGTRKTSGTRTASATGWPMAASLAAGSALILASLLVRRRNERNTETKDSESRK